jgi:type VI secretion system secreted protein VgrG
MRRGAPGMSTMAYSDDRRQATISLALGRDTVLLEQMRAQERLSELFTIEAEVLAPAGELDLLPHLGRPAAIEVLDEDQPLRVLHGLLFDATCTGESAAGCRYRLVLRPWLYLLDQNLDYAIFQDKTALDIIKAVFETRGVGDVDYTRLTGAFRKREYCVQFRESDFAFLSRLMEEEGIYYYFEHEPERHVLTLCNAPSSHAVADAPEIPYVPPSAARPDEHDHLWRWSEEVRTTAQNRITLRNFDFVSPQQPLEARHEEPQQHQRDNVERYDYPAPFWTTTEGETQGQVLSQAARNPRRTFRAEGNAGALACGKVFELVEHRQARFNCRYLVVALSYTIASERFRSGGPGSELTPAIILEAVPAETPWRAPVLTAKPIARGPQTAIVSGPEGEVIHTDKYGRVKVRFHWDRSDADRDKTSCWIRVSHAAAGAGFGDLILPRISQEVIVDFLDGDPDRPIITGRIYNGANNPTYALPANMTRSLWRSETVGTKGPYDGAEQAPPDPGHNEIYMEDKGGAEELHLYAQRNMTTKVRLDEDHRVFRDETKRVGRDRALNVLRNEAKTIEQGDESHTVRKGSRTTTVHKDDALTVQTGDYSLSVSAGKITVEAKISIQLKVGGNTITIDQSGVTVKGLTVDQEAKTSFKVAGAMVQVQGKAITTVQGGIVNIN